VQCAAMRRARCNERYLPSFALPPALGLAAELAEAVDRCELALVAVTTSALRTTLRQLARLGSTPAVIWLCKGFEPGSAKLPHEVCGEELPGSIARGALSGPSFAEEVARGLPTAVTLAAEDEAFARAVALQLHAKTFRVYSSGDVIGVEVAGAVKNVMAIAAGICDGLKLGHNARAALITRGLAEMTRLGVALGGRPETFMGLAGAGDLILTCTGDLSRNRRVGLRLAQRIPLPTILSELGHTAEGVHSAREVAKLADARGVDMPITRAVCRVLYEETAAGDAVEELLSREPTAEHRAG
ncbi:MAG: NAD(P)-dependent glycerol-3-phosphate dehydrogenase, partial [Betaproteobacteria bacterium]|nr:NAD(P)-dependent glycerol-3-phosphate dehydrogenase [Betaproteobacteria bacterium]